MKSKKTIKASAALLALCALLSLFGCSKTDEMVSMYDLKEAMLSADSSLPEMKSASSSDTDAEKLFASVSDYDYSRVEGFFVTYASDGAAYEIAAVAMKDPADVKDMEQSFQKHIDGRITLYKNYAPEQVPLAEKAQIVTSGRYVALIMCDNRSTVKQAFEEAVK